MSLEESVRRRSAVVDSAFRVMASLIFLALLACLIPITISVQLQPGQMGPLFKNVALFGMLLHFANSGSAHHAFALDALSSRRRMRHAGPAQVSV